MRGHTQISLETGPRSLVYLSSLNIGRTPRVMTCVSTLLQIAMCGPCTPALCCLVCVTILRRVAITNMDNDHIRIRSTKSIIQKIINRRHTKQDKTGTKANKYKPPPHEKKRTPYMGVRSGGQESLPTFSITRTKLNSFNL